MKVVLITTLLLFLKKYSNICLTIFCGTLSSLRTRFRKIPGDTCENGTEEDFMPVLTPCPVKGNNEILTSPKQAFHMTSCPPF